MTVSREMEERDARLRVLVVDDDTGLQGLIVKRLTRSGYSVTGVSCGSQAVVAVQEDPELVLVLDQNLPDMPGREVITRLNTDGLYPSFIVMTGQGDERFAVEMMKLGAEDYLVKDTDLLDLLPATLQRLAHHIGTERQLRSTESALRQQEGDYQFLVTHSQDVIFKATTAGVITFASPAWTTLLGHPVTEVVGHSFAKFVHSEDVPVCYAFMQALEDGSALPDRFEYRVQHMDGHWCWHTASVTAVQDDTGQYTGLVGVARDITQRKQSEQALLDSEQNARRKASQLQLVQRMGAAIALELDMDKLLQTLYEQCQQIGDFARFYVGLYDAATDMISYPIFYANGIKVNNSPTCLRDGFYLAGQVIQGRRTVYLRDIDFDSDGILALPMAGQFYQSSLTRSYIGIPLVVGGIVIGILSVQSPKPDAYTAEQMETLDLLAVQVATALHNSQLYEQVQREKVLAEAASFAKQQFLANMSHEIRTPMNGFMGMLQLLERTSLRPEQLEYVNIARTSSEMLLRVINDILDYSKIEAGKMKLECAPLQVRQVVAETVELFLPAAQEKGLAVRKQIAQGVPLCVMGDAFRLRQIVSNLIGNAIKFTTEGEVSIKVVAGSHPNDSLVRLEFAVCDTGMGIPEDKMGALFEGFSQVDASNTRRFGGTGLGLPIARGLVESMGGEIQVESVVGKGSCFSFTCEFEPVAWKDQSQQASTRAPQAEEATRHINVLLVEDDAVTVAFISALARHRGWPLVAAENGRVALEHHQKRDFDVILMDVQMPVMDGLTATRVIRERELQQGKHTPIIAMTAHALREDREKCLQAGMDDYVSKPIDAKILCDMVKKWARGN